MSDPRSQYGPCHCDNAWCCLDKPASSKCAEYWAASAALRSKAPGAFEALANGLLLCHRALTHPPGADKAAAERLALDAIRPFMDSLARGEGVQPPDGTPKDLVIEAKIAARMLREAADALGKALRIHRGRSQAMSSDRPKIEWPKERHVGREGDMGPERLWVTLDADNDVSLSVNLTDTVEFCNTGGNGGGRSPHTRAALINLMAAIERDAAGPEARSDSAVPSSHVSETDCPKASAPSSFSASKGVNDDDESDSGRARRLAGEGDNDQLGSERQADPRAGRRARDDSAAAHDAGLLRARARGDSRQGDAEHLTKAAHVARIRACGAWSDVKDGGTVNEEKCTEAAEAERSLRAAIDALAAVHHEAPEPNQPKAEESILREALAIGLDLAKAAEAEAFTLYGKYPPDGLGRRWLAAKRDVETMEAARSALSTHKE